ncbi:MAG: phosphoribosylglycinamide formyltransferase [Candidatus Omnitrophota bacterium]
MNIAVLASGNGSNFEAIARACRKGRLGKVVVKVLITDKEHSYVRTRAKKFGIKDIFIDPARFSSRRAFEKEIVKVIEKDNIELIVLAGFMRILTPYFVRRFKNRIINIHPALLPVFRGTHAIERAYKRGVKVSGVTVHFVDEEVDHGPIILQEKLAMKEGEGLESFEQRVHRLEHKIYPEAIRLFCERKLKAEKRTVRIVNR